MILENDFNNLTEKDIELLNSYFDGFDYQSSGHTFLANYIWRNTHKITWQIVDGYLFIAGLSKMCIRDRFQAYQGFGKADR